MLAKGAAVRSFVTCTNIIDCGVHSNTTILWESWTPLPRLLTGKAEIATSPKSQYEGEMEHKEEHGSSETQFPGEVGSRCYNKYTAQAHFETGGPTRAGQDQHLDHEQHESEER